MNVSELRNVMLGAVLVLLSTPFAFAHNHSKQYVLGIYSSSGRMSDGSTMLCNSAGCDKYRNHHRVYYIRVPHGMYMLEAPIAVGRSVLGSMFTDGLAPQAHQQWFMDHLHAGDKVLFYAKCNKHDDCKVWMPHPNHPNKEYFTQGYYSPDHGQSNVSKLCGTGKLSKAVEAEACGKSALQ